MTFADWTSRYPGPADLVRSMATPNRINSTHIRALVAHTEDRSGNIELLLDRALLGSDPIRMDSDEVPAVEAFVCEFESVGMLAFTFPRRAGQGVVYSPNPRLVPIEPKSSAGRHMRSETRLSGPTAAIFDAARSPSSLFDGTTVDEFLVEVPDVDPLVHGERARPSFLECATTLASIVLRRGCAFSFIHAPAAAPEDRDRPRRVAGSFLRVGIAVPRFDAARRMLLGRDLVVACHEKGFGLWQRDEGDATNFVDYWRELVPLERDRMGRSWVYEIDSASALLAMTAIGPARLGSTAGVLHLLEQAGAPLGGLAVTTLDDIAFINVMTKCPKRTKLVDSSGRAADTAIAQALGLELRDAVSALRQYRVKISKHPPPISHTLPLDRAVWLTWSTPAVPDALRLTVQTARRALRNAAESHGLVDGSHKRDAPNIEYLICREVSVDRLRGRMKVALNLDALGRSRSDNVVPLESMLGQVCSDIEREWRAELAFALGNPRIELEVVWRESWIGRWATLHGDTGR